MSKVRRATRRIVGVTAFLLAVSVGSAEAGLTSAMGDCMPQNTQWTAGWSNYINAGQYYDCWLLGQHGNFSTTAYTSVWYQGRQIPPGGSACSSVGAMVSYVYNGNFYNATRQDATYGNSASSTAPGANRYIIGSTFFAKKVGAYDFSMSTGGIYPC